MPDKNNKMSKYTLIPTTIESYKHNVDFQMENVKGYLSVNDYQSALIKAKCLVDDLKALVAAAEKEEQP
jgi:hypothetical protein